MAEDSLVPTGIAGLDYLLHGGMCKGIGEFNDSGIIVEFVTNPPTIRCDAATMGWDLPPLQAGKKLQIVFTSPQVIEPKLRSAEANPRPFSAYSSLLSRAPSRIAAVAGTAGSKRSGNGS